VGNEDERTVGTQGKEVKNERMDISKGLKVPMPNEETHTYVSFQTGRLVQNPPSTKLSANCSILTMRNIPLRPHSLPSPNSLLHARPKHRSVISERKNKKIKKKNDTHSTPPPMHTAPLSILASVQSSQVLNNMKVNPTTHTNKEKRRKKARTNLKTHPH
jgi:hypothetical protein